MAAEHVEIGPAAADRVGAPAVEEHSGGVDNAAPALRRKSGRRRHGAERREALRPSPRNAGVELDDRGAFLGVVKRECARRTGRPELLQPMRVLDSNSTTVQTLSKN